MLATRGIDLTGKTLLLLGNGPGSWKTSAKSIQLLRKKAGPNYLIAACNRTAARIGADFACAVDRSMIDEFLDTGVYHNAAMLVGDECFRTAVQERGEIPPGLKDATYEEGGNLFTFSPHLCGTGTGSAAFQTFLQMGASVIYLSGFDASLDPRTRWQGSEHYRTTPTNPRLLDQWIAEMKVAERMAIDEGRVDAVVWLDEVVNKLNGVAACPA